MNMEIGVAIFCNQGVPCSISAGTAPGSSSFSFTSLVLTRSITISRMQMMATIAKAVMVFFFFFISPFLSAKRLH